ncbi:neutral zinc metallopeptidase [Nocardioides sp. MAHUQ-72]|uniref:neutral zinc metallopeptidase n=1 Tax=unclassified Nocardioides TaxID=2615069 RepID=UPI0036169C87
MSTLTTSRSFKLHTGLAVAGVGVLLTAALGGGLGDTSAARLRSTDRTPGSAQALAAGGAGSTDGLVTSADTTDFDSFLASVVEDTANYWSGQLTAWEPQYGTGPWQTVTYQIIDSGQSVLSACTDGAGNTTLAGDPDELAGANPAFFCGADMTIYLSSQWLYDNIWNASGDSAAASDFGVAYAVAHEMGHAVQHDLGITTPADSATVAPTELQADCLAGVWSNEKYYENQLEPGDVEEAVAEAAAVGDYEYTDPGFHGTPEERSGAFMVGYDSGDASSCTLDLADTL